ncbi:MAG TPA: hypothetical protein VGX50_16150 [Longimicrobium sp.]|jgi:hypothetical protein|nr:hypothetical protein [Longimicrobium sp.]
MAPKPTGWNRFVAKLQGEVPAAELEAFRRASGPVLELLEQVERRRLECSIDGLDPWTVPPATRAAFLCAWNAFVLQTLGNEFLDADYRAEPRTPHFVPPVTAKQVLRFYEPVEGWVNRGGQAQANPDYRLDVNVPAALPTLVEADPFPPAHLDGLLHAIRAVRDHAAVAMEFLPATPPAEREKQMQLNRIRQLYASAQARARYAEDLCGTDPVPEVRERAAEHASAAIAQFYLLGQLIADPPLSELQGPVTRPREQRPARPALPPAAATQRAGATGPRLRTRYDRARNQTVTETVSTIDFTGQLSGEVGFSLRLNQVRTPESRSVVLNIRAWARDAYPMLTTGTLTIETDGENSVLRPLPGRERTSRVQEEVSYEEHFGYALPDGLLQKLCTAGSAGLRFKNYRGSVEVDAATIERFQAFCRGFYNAVVRPGEFLEGGVTPA